LGNSKHLLNSATPGDLGMAEIKFVPSLRLKWRLVTRLLLVWTAPDGIDVPE
jgi:hypothetical protein